MFLKSVVGVGFVLEKLVIVKLWENGYDGVVVFLLW